MMHCFLLGIAFIFLTSVSGAQHAPLIDVQGAVSEFISDDEIPQFVIRGIYVTGRVDTMKAVIKTSTVRALGSDYARYKPVLDKVAWIALDSSRSEVILTLHLDGKSIPLPQDSVRGSVRLTVSAATWNGTDWLGTTSEAFTVPVANVSVPRPLISTHAMKVVRSITPNGGIGCVVTGIRLVRPSPDSVDRMPDVRVIEFGDVIVAQETGSLRTMDGEKDGKRSVTLTSEIDSQGNVTVRATLEGQALPPSAAKEPFSFVMSIKGRLRHGHIFGSMRNKSVPVTVSR
ncbi:MAG TPA: hypothetical protein VK147_04820 [Candidatus Didemnitutus sp.]|nr:hypothetical protein [Candidatus Didemnitutus sp.]